MSKKRILITGSGSGFGEGAAIGLARNGHEVIASSQTEGHMPLLKASIYGPVVADFLAKLAPTH